MADFEAHHDAYSRAVFKAFEGRLGPLLAEVAPDWLLHHIVIHRGLDHKDMEERVEIRLVIKPVGSARVIDPDADLLTGPRRIARG